MFRGSQESGTFVMGLPPLSGQERTSWLALSPHTPRKEGASTQQEHSLH